MRSVEHDNKQMLLVSSSSEKREVENEIIMVVLQNIT